MRVEGKEIFNKEEIIINENNARRRAKRTLTICLLVSILLYGIYAICFPQMKITWTNAFVFSISLLIIEFGLFNIIKKGVTISNVFITVYFLILAINNLNISRLQSERALSDIYYLFAGPLAFTFMLCVFDQVKIKYYIRSRLLIDPNKVATVVLLFAILFKTIVFIKTGIRFVNTDWAGGGTGNKYAVGGFSGLAEMSIWLALMLIPQVKRSLKIIISFTAVLLFGIFTISRNNIMMILVYLILCFAYSEYRRLLINKRIMKRLIILFICVIVSFTILGYYRQIMRGWSNPNQSIATLLQSNVNNSLVNWTYAYSAINFDVLLQIMSKVQHPYSLYSIGSPFIRLVAGGEALASYHDSVYHLKGLSGFNASTLFGPMVFEMGPLYIIQAFLLGLQVGMLSYIARLQKGKGHYVYLMTFGALAVFGNFYSIPIYCYTSIVACVLFMFVKQNDVGERKSNKLEFK